MVFDLDLIKKIYSELPGKVEAARKLVGKPLTLTEKILYTHLSGSLPATPYNRGKDYVDFAPDRVAMQDATAQMALLQFMTCGRQSCRSFNSSLRSSDTGKSRCKEDLAIGNRNKSEKYMISLLLFLINMESVSGNPVLESFTR